MKTIFNKTIIMITASLFLSMNINAKDNENPKSVLISDATKTIKEHIKFPNFLIHFNEEEKVNVVFTVNETGEVNLVIANTANETIIMVNSENTKAQMRKGVLELCILSILSQGDAYPTEIIEKLKETKLVVVEGTLYPLLTRLKNTGLLTYRWEESTSGPPRKYYMLTEIGTTYLKELHLSWYELVDAVNKTINKQD
jgi:PadR family transcriptional regulator PadR